MKQFSTTTAMTSPEKGVRVQACAMRRQGTNGRAQTAYCIYNWRKQATSATQGARTRQRKEHEQFSSLLDRACDAFDYPATIRCGRSPPTPFRLDKRSRVGISQNCLHCLVPFGSNGQGLGAYTHEYPILLIFVRVDIWVNVCATFWLVACCIFRCLTRYRISFIWLLWIPDCFQPHIAE